MISTAIDFGRVSQKYTILAAIYQDTRFSIFENFREYIFAYVCGIVTIFGEDLKLIENIHFA
jgi:hypothetical protein